MYAHMVLSPLWFFSRCRYVLKSLIQFIFLGPFILLLMAACIVQGWMNFTAELAKFADRQFYGVSYGTEWYHWLDCHFTPSVYSAVEVMHLHVWCWSLLEATPSVFA